MKRILILGNESENDIALWRNACDRLASVFAYDIISLVSSDWFEKIKLTKYDYLLTKPPGLSSIYKQLYDERLYIIVKILNLPVYPTYEECFIYENKRFLSYWLKANNIPHPQTFVFYDMKESIEFLNKSNYPIVAKTNIGASGSGVEVLRDLSGAVKYVKNTFNGKGAKKRWGPNMEKSGLMKRGWHYILHPTDIHNKISEYQAKRLEKQRDFVIFQEYIDHEYEWRVVRIGESFFAHKKMKRGNKSSGLLIKGYDKPPFELLDFVKGITDIYGFHSQAIDLFYDKQKGYLVNEMQCIFGQSDPYQMLIDGKPGRYRYVDNDWVFEEGDYAQNACYDLRLKYVLDQLVRKNN